MCSLTNMDNDINPRPANCRTNEQQILSSVTVLCDSPLQAFVDLQLAVHSGTEVTEKRKKWRHAQTRSRQFAENSLRLFNDSHFQTFALRF